MDRDREANIRCTWFTQIGYVHGVKELSLIVKDVASSLEVLFLYPGVVSLTDEDAQGLFLNWARRFSGFLQSIRPTQEFEGQNKAIKSRVRSTLMIWDTFAVDEANVVSFLEAEDVEDEYSRAMPGKNKGKGKDREKV
ncbi:hypothetical protein ACFX16_014977 [Malus domestica]